MGPKEDTSDLALRLNTVKKLRGGIRGSAQIRKEESESSEEEAYDNPWEPEEIEEELPWY